MDIEKLELAYNKLSMMHTETLVELIETKRRMDIMSKSWWAMLKHSVKAKLGMKSRWRDE